jgi:hypothetical protein
MKKKMTDLIMAEKINIISSNNNRLLLTQKQLNDYLDGKIDKFYIPMKPDQYEKTPYIFRRDNVFTWEYKVLDATGYKFYTTNSKFKTKFKNNKFNVSVFLDKIAIENKLLKAYIPGIKFKSYDCIRPTIENGLPFKNNWYWEITL